MAVVQNPITGRSRNSFASAIFQTWKGKNVLRAKPLTVANPRTVGQQLQRMKLAMMVFFYRQIAGVIKIGYASQAVGQSEYNAFASEALRNAFTGSTAEMVAWDFSKLLVSKGTISPTTISSVTADSEEYTVEWPTSANMPGQSASDKAIVVIGENDSNGQFLDGVGFVTDGVRSDGSVTVDATGTSIGVGGQVAWLFFVNSQGEVSDSDFYEFV